MSSPFITDEIATTMPTLRAIGTALVEFYRAVVIKHSILTGCTLILWSYYPEHVFNVIRYIVWEIPKRIYLTFVRSFGQDEEDVRQDIHTSRSQSRSQDSLPFAFHQPSYTTTTGYHSDYYIYYVDLDREGELDFFWNTISWLLLIGGILVMIYYNQ